MFTRANKLAGVVNESFTGNGERIRKRRTALRMSQRDLAAKAGVSLGIVSEIENGIAVSQQSLPFIEEALRKEAVSVAQAAFEVLAEEKKIA